MHAATGRCLSSAYGDSFSTEQILRADRLSRHHKRPAGRYRRAFQDDELLSAVTTADNRALAFKIATIEQMYQRGQPLGRYRILALGSFNDEQPSQSNAESRHACKDSVGPPQCRVVKVGSRFSISATRSSSVSAA